MTKIEELRKLAEAASVSPEMWPEHGLPAMIAFYSIVQPSTILQMLDVMEQTGKALSTAEGAEGYESHEDSVGYRVCCQVPSYMPHTKDCRLHKALEAFNKFQEGK